MKRFKDRLKPVLFLLFLVTSAAWGQVTSVGLVNQGAKQFAVNSNDNPVIGLSVTLIGSDIFNQLAVTNLGNAVTNTDITNVQVWWQTGTGQFSPATATLIGVMQATSANSWQNSSPFAFPITTSGKLFVTMDILSSGVNNDTIQVQVPASGCVLGSGAFAASAITENNTQTINAGGATNLTINNVSNSTVSPGAVNEPVLHMKVTASGSDPLLFVTVNNLGTAVDTTDIAAVKMWDQPATVAGGFDPLIATYLGNLNMVSPTQWKNTTQFKWSIDNNNGLWVTVDLKPTAAGGRTLHFDTPALGFQFGSTSLPSGPATNGGVQTIQAGSVQAVNMVPVPADVLLPGQTNALVYQASVSATGGDILNTVKMLNTGSATSGDITSLKLWYQPGGGNFSLGTAILVGIIDNTGSQSWLNAASFQWSVANGDGLYVTADLSPTATVNDTCDFQAPAAAFSFNSGSFAAVAQTNPNNQTITAPGMVTGLSLTSVPAGNYWQNSTGNMLLQVNISATNADILQVMNIVNSAGSADEPTDLQNLTLWYQRGGGTFVPASSVNLGSFTRTGTRQWQFTGINKVLSGDGLYVTGDVSATATVGDTCDFGLAASGVSFQYGGNFPPAALTNSGAQTVTSPPTTSLNLNNIPSMVFPQGSANNPVLDLIVNGSTDTITAFKSTQLGNVTATDVTAAKLWWQPGGGAFNPGTAVQLDTLTQSGGTWKSSVTYVPHIVFNNDALYVTADVAVSATVGHTFQMGVSTAGVSFQVSGAVPPASITNTGIQSICAPFTPTFTPTVTNSPTNSPTRIPTSTPSQTPTNSPTQTPTLTPTPSPTNSPTNTPTNSPSNSPTATPSNSPTASPSPTPTPSPTNSPTNTSTNTPTYSATSTPSNSPTASPSPTPTNSPTNTPTNSPTRTPTGTSTNTPTNTPTLTSTNTLTLTPSNTPTGTATSTATNSPTNTSANTPTYSATSTPSNSPTASPSPTPTNSPTNTSTNSPTNSPSNSPTATPSHSPTATPTNTATLTATNSPSNSPTNTPVPTGTFTLTLTFSFTPLPSNTPTPTPTFSLTFTSSATNSPTATATASPSPTPTNSPTNSFTSTFSFTATPSPTSSYTHTLTFTPTSTWTPTSTFTSTYSFTPTNSSTPTDTSTPTLTPTMTDTPTITFTPTNSLTFTPTGSVTATPTPDVPLYLDENFFNPLRQPLGLDVRVDKAGWVKIVAYNLIGQEVGVIFDQDMPAGNFRAYWDGHNRFGEVLGNGLYFIVIFQPSGHMTQKVIILK